MDILNNYNLEEDAERGASYTLLDPRTGKELDIVFNLKGADSPSHDKLMRDEQSVKLIEGEDYDLDLGLKRILVGLITDWKNIQDGDEEFVYSPENALRLLTEKKWVFDQLQNFVETRTNFFLD